MGGIYPKGLLIGEVTVSELQDNDLFYRVTVAPSATEVRIEEVVVLTGATPQPELGAGE
jgi:cell shape-determining protein MreC